MTVMDSLEVVERVLSPFPSRYETLLRSSREVVDPCLPQEDPSGDQASQVYKREFTYCFQNVIS